MFLHHILPIILRPTTRTLRFSIKKQLSARNCLEVTPSHTYYTIATRQTMSNTRAERSAIVLWFIFIAPRDCRYIESTHLLRIHTGQYCTSARVLLYELLGVATGVTTRVFGMSSSDIPVETRIYTECVRS